MGPSIGVLMALALFVLAFFARVFALTVQDRVIRLEMRLRLAEILPADLRPRIPEFTVGQLVSLRFAGDAELPALARKVLDEKIERSQGHQAIDQGLAGGLSEGLVERRLQPVGFDFCQHEKPQAEALCYFLLRLRIFGEAPVHEILAVAGGDGLGNIFFLELLEIRN